MKCIFANDALVLLPRELVSVMVDKACALRVDCGLVWVTVEGQSHDHWLAAGDTLALVPGRHIVIEADAAFSRIDVLVALSGPSMEQAGRSRDNASATALL